MSGKTHKNWDKNLTLCRPRVAPVSVGEDTNQKNPLRWMQCLLRAMDAVSA